VDSISQKCCCGRGSASSPAGKAYSDPQTPKLDFGAASGTKKRKRRKRRGGWGTGGRIGDERREGGEEKKR